MDIKELINELQKYPSDMPVIVEGHEGGYDDISEIKEVSVILNHNDEWYLGRHAGAELEEKPGTPALLLSGENVYGKELLFGKKGE
jgi:hypothetical protein